MQRELALGEAWKVVGKVPELGSGVPEVAPYMQWSNGHVWTYEGRMRHGTWEYKVRPAGSPIIRLLSAHQFLRGRSYTNSPAPVPCHEIMEIVC